jgi:hypothetical protein
MKYILLAALISLLSHQSFGQKGKNYIDSTEVNIAEVKEELIKIKDDYYVIQPVGNAGNIGLFVGKEGVILVDNQWAKLARV